MKPRFEDRLHDCAERMMHDAVAKRRRRHDPPLGVADLERDVAAGPVFTPTKLPLQGKKLALQIGEERRRARLLALAFDGPAGGRRIAPESWRYA